MTRLPELEPSPVVNTGSPISLPSSLHVSDQQVYVSIGTFMAFVVKSILGASASTVFDQFAAVERLHGAQPVAVSTLSNFDDACDDLLASSSGIDDHIRYTEFGFRPVQQACSAIGSRIDFASTNFANLGWGLTVNTKFTDTPEGDGSVLFQPVEDQYTLYSGPTPEAQRVVTGASTQKGAISSNPLGDGPPLSLYVAIFPHMVDCDASLDNVHLTARSPTIVRCVLHNATYQTNSTYVNGDQSVQVTNQAVQNSNLK